MVARRLHARDRCISPNMQKSNDEEMRFRLEVLELPPCPHPLSLGHCNIQSQLSKHGVSFWERVRTVFGSCLLIQKGNGASARAMNPSKLLPHPNPRASYIDSPASGSMAPATDRTTVLAASELAANMVNASTRYLLREELMLVPGLVL